MEAGEALASPPIASPTGVDSGRGGRSPPRAPSPIRAAGQHQPHRKDSAENIVEGTDREPMRRRIGPSASRTRRRLGNSRLGAARLGLCRRQERWRDIQRGDRVRDADRAAGQAWLSGTCWVKEAAFRSLVDPLREQAADLKGGYAEGHAPIVLVVTCDVVSPCETVPLLRLTNGRNAGSSTVITPG
jgi:hypothetical protein